MGQVKLSPQPVAIDLFCGAGGLTHGLRRAGIRVALGVDVDPAAKYPYETNNPRSKFLLRDIWKLSPSEVVSHYPRGAVRILAGCAPCQPFSSYTQGTAVEQRADWRLLDRFAMFAEALEPQIVTMENVTNLRRHEVYQRFTDRLTELGYTVSDHDVECWRYGVPQMRTRLVLLASRHGAVDLVRPTHGGRRLRTVRHAIGNLSKLRAGASSLADPLHRSAALSKRNLRRIRASKPGGTWRDWDPRLRSPCHLSDRGFGFSPVYGRMSWEEPAPTITTRCFNYGSGRFGHPSAARAISLREAALLQSFPPGYEFVPANGDVHFMTIGRLVGNAVPVRLGEIIGRSIVRHLGVANGF